MDHIERFVRTIERKPVHRPATWIGEPVHSAIPALLKHFGVDFFLELKKKVHDDVYHVNVPYQSPTSNHVAAAFDFAKKDGLNHDYEERTLTAPGSLRITKTRRASMTSTGLIPRSTSIR